MRVRQHESVERAAAPQEVRKHRRATRIAAAPCGTRIEQHPVPAIRSKEDRVALSNVENMELHAIAARHRERRKHSHAGQSSQPRHSRTSWKATATGDDECNSCKRPEDGCDQGGRDGYRGARQRSRRPGYPIKREEERVRRLGYESCERSERRHEHRQKQDWLSKRDDRRSDKI